MGVHVNTVRSWTDQGRLSCLRINDRGDRRYRPAELDRFLAGATGTPRPRNAGRPAAAPSVRERGKQGQIADALATLQLVAESSAATGDLDEMLTGIASALCETAGYSAALYMRPDGEARPLCGWMTPDPLLAHAAVRRSRPVRGPRHDRPARRSLAVPLSDGHTAAGVLHLERSDPGSLGVEAELALLGGIAAQVGAALAGERRRGLSEEQGRRAGLLLAMGGEIASQLDLPRSLSQLVEHAIELFGADHCAMFRHLPAGGFAHDVSRNLSPEFVRAVEQAPVLPLIAEAFEDGTIVSAFDYADDPRALSMRGPLLAEGINTVTVAPLISDGERLGVLALFHDQRYEWNPENRSTLELLARQGAVAVRNARNYGQMATWAAQLQSIQQLGARLTRLTSVREIGQAIAAELHQLIDYHNVRVYRVMGEDVVPVAWRGEVGEYTGEDGDQLRVRVGQGITGWVARHGLAQNLGDAAADHRTETIPGTEDDLPESLLLAPMLKEDQVIGVIVLAKLGLHQFTADDLRLLEIYASIAAQAMANADVTERLRAQSAALERQLQSQRELLRVTESILGTLDTQALLEEIAERLGSLLLVDNIGVDIHDQATRQLRPIFARGVNAAEYLGRTLPDDQGVASQAVRSGEVVLVQNEPGDGQLANLGDAGPRPGALIVAPLRSRDMVTGLLTIERLGSDAHFSEEEFELIKLFAGHVSIALNNAEAHRAVELRAQTDALTGLHNQGSLSIHLQRAVEHREPFSLLMLDLDDFKMFNDRRGHQAGNVMLERLAGVLRAACRDSDVIFRYGGDEFAIVLPQTNEEGALEVAAKVGQAVRDVTDGRRPIVRVTASIGLATYPADGSDAASVLLAADRACYAAKRKGRDRVATAVEGLALANEFLPSPTPVDQPHPAYSAA